MNMSTLYSLCFVHGSCSCRNLSLASTRKWRYEITTNGTVEKAYRGADYGRMIMEAAENFAKEQGYHKITLGAQVTAVGFYERLGYQKQEHLLWMLALNTTK